MDGMGGSVEGADLGAREGGTQGLGQRSEGWVGDAVFVWETVDLVRIVMEEEVVVAGEGVRVGGGGGGTTVKEFSAD